VDTLRWTATARWTAALVAAWVCVPATAQELREVSPARSGTLSGPLNAVEPGLRAPSTFDRVYRLMNQGKDTGTLARAQGGLIATFPESQYTGTGAIPAGTVFHIGTPRTVSPSAAPARRPGVMFRPAPGATSAREPVENSARGMLRAPAPMPAQPIERLAPRVSLFTDESYRVRVVGTLLDRAVAAK